MTNYSDESMLGSYLGRTESPGIELAMQDAIARSMAELMSRKGLYQNLVVNTGCCDQYKATSQALRDEMSMRPWYPTSLGHGDSLSDREVARHARCGSDPLGTPANQMSLPFPLPDIETWCDTCKKTTVHTSTLASMHSSFGKQFPVLGPRTLQVFIPYYSCALCRKQIVVFMIKRKGFALQLCGRSERRKYVVPDAIPAAFRDVFADALSASGENDVFGGIYHLRTFIEHYMKNTIGIAQDVQIRGDELCLKYGESLDFRMTAGLPSLAALYSKASKIMHGRKCDSGDFDDLAQGVLHHLEAKALFAKYGAKT